MPDVTFELLMAVRVGPEPAQASYQEAFRAPGAAAVLARHGISLTRLRVAHFVAQVFAETGDLTVLTENMNYSVRRLMQVWPKRFPTAASAAPYAHKPEALANRVYGGRMGNTAEGDGYRFRGRGLLQITGREAYTRYGKQLRIDLAGEPDLAFGSAHCLEVAAAEWAASGHQGKSCNALADEDDLEGVTRAINGGLTGLEDRKFWLSRAKAVWPVGRVSRPQPASRAVASLDLPGIRAASFLAADGVAATASFDPRRAALLGRFVGAAYTMYNNNPGALMPPASADFPPGYKLIGSIQMQDFVLSSTDPVFYGFMAQNKADPNDFVLAIRGTSNWTEWWDDANAGTATPFRVPGCGAVGDGFARIYDTLKTVDYGVGAGLAAARAPSGSMGSFAAQVRALVSHNLPRPGAMAAAGAPVISVVGHSLGAALATMYVLENAKTEQIHNPVVCTFASPRVGDADFVAAFNALELRSWRVANGPDLVPHLPPEFLGFAHVDTLQAVSSTGKVKPNVGCWHALSTYLSLIDPNMLPDAGCRLTARAAEGAIRAVGLRRAPSVMSAASDFGEGASPEAVSASLVEPTETDDVADARFARLLPVIHKGGAAGYVNASEINHIGGIPDVPEMAEAGARITFRNRSILDVEDLPEALGEALQAMSQAMAADIYPPPDWEGGTSFSTSAGAGMDLDTVSMIAGDPDWPASEEEPGSHAEHMIAGDPNYPSIGSGPAGGASGNRR